jgi:hypothetical protein
MIGGRLLFRELRIAIGQALQLGALRGRAFSDGAHRQAVGKRPEMISEGVLVSLSHVVLITRRKFALR